MKTFSELFRLSWQIYTTQFGFFLKAVALFIFPLLLLRDFIPAAELPTDLGAEQLLNGTALANGQSFFEWLAQYYFVIEPQYIWYAIAVQVVLLVATFVIIVAVTSGTARVLAGKKIVLEYELRRNRQVVLPAMLTTLLAFVITTLLYIPFIVPGVIVDTLLVFTGPAVVLGGQRYMGALRYSRELVRGNWWDVFFKVVGVSLGVSFLAALFVVGMNSVLIIPGLGAVVDAIVQLAALFVTVFVTVLFIDMESMAMLKRLGEARVTQQETKKAGE